MVERNEVHHNHVGFSIGNETHDTHSGGHIIRNNISYDNVWTGIVFGSNAPNAWVENTRLLNNTFYRNNTQAVTLLAQKDWAGQVIIQNGNAVPFTFGDAGEIVTQKLSNSSDAPGAKIVVQNNIFRSRKGKPIVALNAFKTDSYTSASLTSSNIKTLLDWNYNLYYIEPGFNNAINYDFASAGFTGNTFNTANYKASVGIDSASLGIELSTTPSPDPVFVGGTVFPGRFALVSGSAAYNIGNPSASTSGTDDFIWNERIMGGRIDAGALEFFVECSSAANLQPLAEENILSANSYAVFPNPVVNQLTIRITQKQRAQQTIEVMDMGGRLIIRKQVQTEAGINNISINNLKGAGFTSGVYIVNLSTGKETRTFKIVVQ